MIKEIQKKICRCDCCKKEFEVIENKDTGSTNVRTVNIPMSSFSETGKLYDKPSDIIITRVDLCEDCCRRLTDVISNNFHDFYYVMWEGVTDSED